MFVEKGFDQLLPRDIGVLRASVVAAFHNVKGRIKPGLPVRPVQTPARGESDQRVLVALDDQQRASSCVR